MAKKQMQNAQDPETPFLGRSAPGESPGCQVTPNGYADPDGEPSEYAMAGPHGSMVGYGRAGYGERVKGGNRTGE